jgi:hypothetical protein
MTQRQVGLAALLIAVLLLGFGARQCMRGPSAPADPGVPVPSTGTANAPAAGPDDAVAAAERQRQAQTVAAMEAVVSAVHAYLAALGKPDKADADAFWSGGRVPARSGEADLRQLGEITSLRSENGRPVAIDAGTPPAAFEVPVSLRVGTVGSALRRYEGSYRLRRAITGDRWEITSADIRASSAAP